MPPLPHVRQPEIIDLVSDSDSEDDVQSAPGGNLDAHGDGPLQIHDEGGEIDFEDFPDFDDPPDDIRHPAAAGLDNNIDGARRESEALMEDGHVEPNESPQTVEAEASLSEAECLQMVIDVLPDIAVGHVLALIDKLDTRSVAECERLIADLLDDDNYPREADGTKGQKRKQADSEDDESQFTNENYGRDIPDYHNRGVKVLREEFRDMPITHIGNVLRQHKTIFNAFAVLETQRTNHNNITAVPKIASKRKKANPGVIQAQVGDIILEELQAAKRAANRKGEKQREAEERRRAEEVNVMSAQRNGEMSECLCCYDEFPLNRMVFCSGDTIHFFCRTCAKKWVEEELNQQKCRPVCFADPACGGTFTPGQLEDFLESGSFARLQRLQQQEEIQAAGLDLAECPFCDFKAECPDVEIDKEFRCQNPECRKISCRLCNRVTHIPKTCEEVTKDDHLSVRHTVEEAKSNALIRKCNRCKNAFIKEYGCNKMTCYKCHNTQCYICSKDVKGYDHFGNSGSKCPLHDNHEARHEEEVQRAEAEAVAKIRAERPDISEEELKVHVSDRVKQAEQARLTRAAGQNAAFPHHMHNGQLRAGPAPVAPAEHALPRDFQQLEEVFDVEAFMDEELLDGELLDGELLDGELWVGEAPPLNPQENVHPLYGAPAPRYNPGNVNDYFLQRAAPPHVPVQHIAGPNVLQQVYAARQRAQPPQNHAPQLHQNFAIQHPLMPMANHAQNLMANHQNLMAHHQNLMAQQQQRLMPQQQAYPLPHQQQLMALEQENRARLLQQMRNRYQHK